MIKKFNNFINENENFDSELDQLLLFLDEHDFDFYGGFEDFEKKWDEITNNSELTNEQKSSIITSYLDEKWGLYDGYDEVYKFLIDILK
jgi:hypothetical protein